MSKNNQSCTGGVISAFFTGAALGAGLALIFAPVSGKEARQTIVNQYEEIKDKMKELETKLRKAGGKNPSDTAEDDDEEMEM